MSTLTLAEANSEFFAEFMKCVSSEAVEEEPADVCLISGEPLGQYSVKLTCGHKFNYLPLFNALVEFNTSIRKDRVILEKWRQCPYCREPFEGLLPYIPGCKVKKEINSPFNRAFGENSCCYIKADKTTCGTKCYYDKCYRHVGMETVVTKQCSAHTKHGGQCKNKVSNKVSSVELYCKLHNK